MDLNGDRQRLYSSHVIKLNRHRKSDARVLVLCDRYIYLLHKNYQSSKKSPIEVDKVKGLSISPGDDQALVIHFEVRERKYVLTYKYTDTHTDSHR